MSENNLSVDSFQSVTGDKYVYIGTTTLKVGQALCRSFDLAQGSLSDSEIQRRRTTRVEKPDIRHRSDDFAGIVAPGQAGLNSTGALTLELIPFSSSMPRLVQVYTDQSVTSGQLVGLQPGSFNLGRYCGFGRPLGRFTQTVDRSTTAGTAWAVLGGAFEASDVNPYATLFRADFTGDVSLSSTANLGNLFSTVGTSSTTTISASSGQGGVLAQASISTGFLSNVNLVGEPFALAVGNPLFFRARFAVDSIASTTSAFVGLSITDPGYWASKGSDYIGFEVVTGALAFVYRKASGTAVASSTLKTLVANTYVEVAFYWDGKSALSVWVDNVAQTITNTPASIPTRTLTYLSEAAIAAVVLSTDRILVGNVK